MRMHAVVGMQLECLLSPLLVLHAQAVNWRELLLTGDTPAPRKGAAAAASADTIVMFGGTGSNAEEQPVVLDELVVCTLGDNDSLSCRINPGEVSGPRPCARSGASLLEFAQGQLLLYGGFGVDGRPIDDAYLFNVAALQWSKVYNGHANLVGQEGKRKAATSGGGIVTRRHVRSQQEWRCLPRWEPTVKDRC
jgi:hypothetical protein